MTRLDSWLSADVMHALGWALIHSLWQCLALAALAAMLMAFSRRPSLRYLVATGALALMLVAPAATFLVLMKPSAPVQAQLPGAAPLFVAPIAAAVPAARTLTANDAPAMINNGTSSASAESSTQFLASWFPSTSFLTAAILPWLVGAWLCGVALFSLRLAGGFLLLEYRRFGEFNLPGPRILAICLDLQHQLGLDRAIRYLECGWLRTPAVIGWVRPVILLPVQALTGLSEIQLRAVIAHELAHVRRLDAFVNLLQILVETLLFYHPAVWWLNRRIRIERELACDEIAVRLTGDRIEYAKTLTLMAEWEQAPRLVMAANRGPLSERVFHILGQKPFGKSQRILGLTVSILFLAAALGGANALFAIAYPAIQAKVSFKVAPSRTTLDPIAAAHQGVQTAISSDSSSGIATRQEQADIAAIRETRKLLIRGHAGKLLVPLSNLSTLLPAEPPLTSILAASNDPPPAPNGPVAALRTAVNPKGPVCAAPSVMDSADLKAVPGGDLRTVQVAINGEPKQFLLDIGADPTEISQAAASDLALPDANRATSSTFISGLQPVALLDVKGSRSAEDYRPHVRVVSFALGHAVSRNLIFAVATDPELGKSKPYDGLMTGDFFRQYDAELDFAHNKLSYLAPTDCSDPDQVAYWPHAAVATIPMTSLGGKIQIEVLIQGQAIPAVIDTSASHTVMRRDIAELMFGLKADTPDMTPDGDVTDGAGLQVYRHTFAQISFPGGVTAYNVPALIQAGSMIRNQNRAPVLGSRATFVADPRQRIPGLTLGMDVLQHLHLYVVQGQQMLYVTAAGPS